MQAICEVGVQIMGVSGIYQWVYQVYRGKLGETVSSKGLSYDVVMGLVNGMALLSSLTTSIPPLFYLVI